MMEVQELDLEPLPWRKHTGTTCVCGLSPVPGEGFPHQKQYDFVLCGEAVGSDSPFPRWTLKQGYDEDEGTGVIGMGLK